MPLSSPSSFNNLTVERALDYYKHSTDGSLLLHAAAMYDNADVIRALIQAGASPNAPYRFWIPLNEAARYGHLNSLSALLECGASIDERDNSQRTALSVAIEENQYEVVQELIRLGADLNTTDDGGRTPLIHAIRRKRLNCFRALMEAGANPDIADKKGDNARDYARRFCRDGWFEQDASL